MNEKFCEELDKVASKNKVDLEKRVKLSSSNLNSRLSISEAQESILQCAIRNYLEKNFILTKGKKFSVERNDAKRSLYDDAFIKALIGHKYGDIIIYIQDTESGLYVGKQLIIDLKCSSSDPIGDKYHGGSVTTTMFSYPTYIQYIVSCSLYMDAKDFKLYTFPEVKRRVEESNKTCYHNNYAINDLSCTSLGIDDIIKSTFSEYLA